MEIFHQDEDFERPSCNITRVSDNTATQVSFKSNDCQGACRFIMVFMVTLIKIYIVCAVCHLRREYDFRINLNS